MCLLIVKEKGIQRPSWEHLDSGWKGNSDGVGIAWTRGDGFVSFKKFLEYSDFKKFVKTAEFTGKEEEYAIMYHFRWATHGSVKLQNVHPFVLSNSTRDIMKTEGKARSVVAHNGVISNVGSDPHTDFSDTMVFVRDYLSERVIRENLSSSPMQDLLEKFIGHSKVAVLDGTGKFSFISKHLGITEKTGVWYSNSGYKSYTSYRPLSLPSVWNNGCGFTSKEVEGSYEDDDDGFDERYNKILEANTTSLNKPFESANQRKEALKKRQICDYCQVTVTELRSDGYGSRVCNSCWESYFNN